MNGKPESGRQRFGRFREMLREHGFRLGCDLQAEDAGMPIERWTAINTLTGKTASFMVVTAGAGFDVYLQSQSIAMQDDVAALVKATGGDPGGGY